MKTIYKYAIGITDRQTLLLTAGSNILSAGKDAKGQLCIWATVDSEARLVDKYTIYVNGTGRPLTHDGIFLGTVLDGYYVWHIFCKKEEKQDV